MAYGRNPQNLRIKNLKDNNQEQPLPKHGSCNLGSINLSAFVKDPFTSNAAFDFEEFEKAIDVAIRTLDKNIDENAENHALREQRDVSKKYRNVGLGICGLYDMFVKLSIEYGSQESINIADAIMNSMFINAVYASNRLAAKYGKFPGYSEKIWDSAIIRSHFTAQEIYELKKKGLRNCSLLSVAPTGSISTMLQVSSGVEPAYALSYSRKTESLNNGNDEYYDVNIGIVDEFFKATCSATLPDCFKTALDIDWHNRVDMQATIQEHVDTAISSTINIPFETTVEDVEKLYLTAWRLGLKGVTIFREGCKRDGILKAKDKVEQKSHPIETPTNAVGKKRKLTTGCGTLHCLAYFDKSDGRLLEVYFGKGSTGGCANFMNGLARMTSLCSRSNVDLDLVVDQLMSTGVCPSYAVRKATKNDTSKGSCCPMAIGYALVDMHNEMLAEISSSLGEKKSSPKEGKPTTIDQCDDSSGVIDKCPRCGEPLPHTGKCMECKNCGWYGCD